MDNIEKLETKLVKLQNDIHLQEKRIHSMDTVRRSTSLNNKSELKKNSLEMKQLRMQIEELQVFLKRQQLADDKLIHEALQKKGKRFDVQGKSTKEILQVVESRVFELSNKNESLSRRLENLERILNEKKGALSDMTEQCCNDDLMTEADCLQYIRHLENEHLKVITDIKESEEAKNKMKHWLEHLQKERHSHSRLLTELMEENTKMEMKDGRDAEKQEESERKPLDEKEVKFESLQEKLSLIRDATCCYDIKDIESLFLEQNSVLEELSGAKKKAEKRLEELKAEKRYLTSKRASIKEADTLYPKKDEELAMAKHRLNEQEIRHTSAKEELERLDSVTSKAKGVFQRLLSIMRPKAKITEADENINHLSKRFENVMMHTFPNSNCLASNLKK